MSILFRAMWLSIALVVLVPLTYFWTEPASAVSWVNVNTTADVVDGNPSTTSLREAITMANSDGDATEITLAAGQTYQLTLCGGDDNNAAGDLDHTDAAQVQIYANGSTIEQTCPGERVITHHNTESRLAIFDATITGGHVTGVDMDLDGNSAGGGGGILSYGRTMIKDSHVTGNHAEDLGSGVRSLGGAYISDSTIDNNTGTGGGAAIGRESHFYWEPNLLNAVETSFDNNDADGLYLAQGTLWLDGVSASGNGHDGVDGQFFIANVTDSNFDGNTGAGFEPIDGIVRLTESTASNNGGYGVSTTGDGGVELTRTTVAGNGLHGVFYGTCGGDPTADAITLLESTVAGNAGTGVYGNACGRILVDRSTLTANTGGGFFCLNCDSMEVRNSTVSANLDVGVTSASPNDILLNQSTIVANHGANVSTTADVVTVGTVIADAVAGPNCAIGGVVTSGGSNADTDNSCGLVVATDQPGLADVGLEPLAYNGGTTQTHALETGSPLLDAAGPGCAVPTDQRGESRPSGLACDIGAYESQMIMLRRPVPLPADRIQLPVRILPIGIR